MKRKKKVHEKEMFKGTVNPKGKSRYARKKRAQKKGHYLKTSPFGR